MGHFDGEQISEVVMFKIKGSVSECDKKQDPRTREQLESVIKFGEWMLLKEAFTGETWLLHKGCFTHTNKMHVWFSVDRNNGRGPFLLVDYPSRERRFMLHDGTLELSLANAND